MTPYIGPLVILGITLFITLVVYLTSDAPVKNLSPNLGARIFLVLLRLTIGWHLFYEGWEKVNDPSWTSEYYLRGAVGPLAPKFRDLAGTPTIDKLTPGEGKGIDAFPPPLDKEWQRYFDEFVAYYELSDETKVSKSALTKSEKKKLKKKNGSFGQLELAKIRLDQAKSKFMDEWLKEPQIIEKYSPYMERLAKMTIPERIEAYKKALEELEQLETEMVPKYGTGVEKKLEFAIANAQQIYKSLQNDLNQQNKALQDSLHSLLNRDQLKRNRPTTPPPPMGEWTLLNWSDFVVQWGLTVAGACLLLGLFTRLGAIIGAALLLMFFLAMPPIAPWPANPKAEGTYLFINKNIIEMMGLMVLAFSGTGRWFGIDGLISGLLGGRKKTVSSQTQTQSQ